MPSEIRIPKLSAAMTHGTLVEWLVADGDTISPGTPLYRLETDKVESDIESPAAGTVRLVAAPDHEYEVGTVIAEILEPA